MLHQSMELIHNDKLIIYQIKVEIREYYFKIFLNLSSNENMVL